MPTEHLQRADFTPNPTSMKRFWTGMDRCSKKYLPKSKLELILRPPFLSPISCKESLSTEQDTTPSDCIVLWLGKPGRLKINGICCSLDFRLIWCVVCGLVTTILD